MFPLPPSLAALVVIGGDACMLICMLVAVVGGSRKFGMKLSVSTSSPSMSSMRSACASYSCSVLTESV